MESYSVQAVLSAVDRNFSKTFASATKAADSFGNNTTKSTGLGGKGMIKFGAVAGAATAVVSKALSVVTSNVGNAVDRFDTLNKYPVVMKALGYSTQDTGKSMKLLSNGIDGLPTSLNEITSAAQQFAPLTGSATSGAKAALALNDAFLASGASVADTSRGMQQYTQMLATGKVDMQSWRTLQETMPIALRKTANAFGFTGKSAEQDLFKALQSGQITIDDLNKKFVELDKGQNGFSSLARKNSVGIKTSFTNLGTAVTKGLAGTLTAINNGLKKAKLGGIADLINNMKGGINTAFDAINGTITTYIPVIVNTIKTMVDFVKKNKGWIMPLTAGISGFVAAFVAMNKVISIVKSVGSAMSGLFSILTANPFVLVIALIAALVAGLYYFFTQTKIGKKLWESFSKAVGGSGNAIKIAGLAVVALGTGLLGLVLAFKKPLGMVKQFTGTTKAAGKYAGISGGQLAGMGVKAAGIGIGIGAAAAGIGVLAFGIAALAKTGTKGLVALGAMTGTIIVLAATFAILQGPLTAAVPAMLSLSAVMLSAGAAALMIGGSIALAGLGIKLASQGVMILVQAFILLGNNINMIIPLLTVLGAGLAALVVTFLSRVISAVPQIAAQFFTMFTTLLNMIATYTPVLVAGFASIVIGFISSLITYVPQIVAKVVALLVAMMNAVAQNAPLLITAFVNMVVKILQSLTDNLPKFISAGVDFIVSLLKGVEDSIGKIVPVVIDIIVEFINSIANNLSKIINAGINLLAKFIMGIVNAIPRLASIAVQAVEKFVYGVGNALGQVLRSGTKLLGIFVQGIMDGFGKSRSSGSGAANAVKDGIMSISLSGAGRAIMNGFLGGLQSAWGAVQSFVGGIASWIRQHKGPISYDRKLLIPAGNAIMTGLNAGLVENFKTVQKNVSGMAGSILDAATSVGNLATNAIGDPINALNNNIGGSYSSVMTLDHTSTTQPANITIGFDKHGYTAYVDDINNQQGKTALLKRNNSVQL
ncbi:tape measure protein [Leuconostoc falkenbergense]|uniref:tape measure protein n=1 Tax=Leuconostoc falkenbergense TaxID=2766470 RepID=UPI00293C39F9|nr:tape measure protein [Leuconostoc falkenbergense]MDV3545194.1 tape measure protein [Leuconostoc falkenbergense]